MLSSKYRIERVLGEGGMGVVVEATDVGLERRVAIKFLLPEFANNQEATQRFMREARAAVKIQSEHVARVIDVGKLDGGAPYMVMEFLEGSDLSQTLDDEGPLSVDEAALHVVQACEALAEAHAHGIVHRDLKPANLFLARQAGGARKTKVLDFGISKVMDTVDAKLTRTSTAMGSPLYMSPEQMKSARDVDSRSDIWALGVILHEALSGKAPFDGSSIPEISAQILLEEPKRLNEIDARIPAELADVATRCLRKSPDERYQNVGALATALLPFARDRARAHVERVLRVLKAAGMSDAESSLSARPAPAASELDGRTASGAGSRPRPDPASSAHGLPARTMANWGQTRGQRRSAARSRQRLLIAAIASLVTVGGLAAAVLTSTDPAAGPLTTVTPAASLAAASQPAPAEALPAAEPADARESQPEEPAATGPDPAGASQPAPHPVALRPATGELDDVEGGSEGESEIASDSATQTPPVEPEQREAKPPVVTSRKKPRRVRSRTTTRPKDVTKPKTTTDSVDFKTKFGSRK